MRTATAWLAILLAAAAAQSPGPGDWSPSPEPRPLPQLEIEGPATAPAGTLVTLTARTTAPKTAWILAAGNPSTWRTDTNGRTVTFASPQPGQYTFVAAAADSAALVLAEHQITLTGTDPAPAPGPDPSPDPIPAPDAGRYNLAATTLALCRALPPTDRPLIAAIATNYNNAARRIAAGDPTWQTPDQIRRQTAEANRATLGEHRARLLPLLFEPLARTLAGLETAPGLSTATDLATAWREIAAGLDAWSRRQ